MMRLAIEMPKRLRLTANAWRVVFSLFVISAGLAPLVLANDYWVYVCVHGMIYGSLAIGLAIIVSTGLLDLGYIAYFAVGAYTYAILNTRLGMAFWLAIPTAAIICGIGGMVLAVLSMRVRSDYFVLLTLAFGGVVGLLLKNLDSLTNGPQGIVGIERPVLFWPVSSPRDFYYMGLGWLSLVFFCAYRISTSRLGAAWLSTQEDSVWLRSTGCSVLVVRVCACVFGAMIAAITGVIYASWQTFVAPESFTLMESIFILCMVVIGGGIRGNLPGVVLSAFLLGLLPEFLREFHEYRMMTFGLGMTLIAVLRSSRTGDVPWSRAFDAEFFKTGPVKTHTELLKRWTEDVSQTTYLRLVGLTKSYEGVQALGSPSTEEDGNPKGFTHDFRRNRIYGIIGLNGAGKTTLFNCIRGLCIPDLGVIEAGDKVLFQGLPTPASANERSIGPTGLCQRIRAFVARVLRALGLSHHDGPRLVGTSFQTCSNLESLPAWKNVFMALRPLDGAMSAVQCITAALCMRTAPIDIAAKDFAVGFLVEKLGFPREKLEVPVRELPYLERRMVELAKAYAPGRPIVLLDEPTAGLSEHERSSLVKRIRTISKGRIVLVIEHNHEVLQDFADEVLYMEAGNLGIDEDRPLVGAYEDIVTNTHVASTYLWQGRSCTAAEPPSIQDNEEPVLRAEIHGAGYTRGAPVLKSINLELPKASIVGLIGLNGAGKTTLLRCLMNSQELGWVRGRINILRTGHQITLLDSSSDASLTAHETMQCGLVLVRQEGKIFGTMSVEENLTFGAIVKSISTEDREAALSWYCRDVLSQALGMAERECDELSIANSVLLRRASHLSGGQQQLVAIGRALISFGLVPTGERSVAETPILLLDEPTSGLQPSIAARVFDCVLALKRELGVTVLITEQSGRLGDIADVLYRLEGGQLWRI